MPTDTLLRQIREGMTVKGSDGRSIGKVKQVYFGNQENYLEVWVQHGLGMGVEIGRRIYIPQGLIADLRQSWLRKHVVLTVDAETAKTRTRQPAEMAGQWEPKPHTSYDATERK